MTEGSEKPFGETTYLNYDPDQVNSVEDAANLFDYLSSENLHRGETTAASVFDDCADLLRDEVIGDD